MKEINKHCKLRVLMLISGCKVADKATKLLIDDDLPVFYQFRGQGTASSEMMDLLGLGSTTKIISVSIMQKAYADGMLAKMESELHLGDPDTGIAFTMALSGASHLTMKVVDEYARRELFENMENDVKQTAACSSESLIVAIVNQGYSEDVMDAAKEFGARGGTVVHTRQVGGEAILNFLGVPVQEEKELVFIISQNDMKPSIMKSIGEKCGLHSEAQGVMISMPIDSLVGLGNNE